MAIPQSTRSKIKGYLEAFVDQMVARHKGVGDPDSGAPLPPAHDAPSADGSLKPFHSAIIPAELMRISAFERSFSTRLGTTIEECARLIALDHHPSADRGYRLRGPVSQAALDEAARQRGLYEEAGAAQAPKPAFEDMVAAVLAARREDDLVARTVIADLRVVAHQGTEYFFEMTSPKPNKGQCLEKMERLLRFHLFRGDNRPSIYAYVTMAYNPYGARRSDYAHAYPRRYMPFDQVVLIAHEFWDIIGGPTTYSELLDVYQEVGRHKAKHMIDALAFGF